MQSHIHTRLLLIGGIGLLAVNAEAGSAAVTSFQTFESGFSYGPLNAQNGWTADTADVIQTSYAKYLDFSIEVRPNAAGPNGRGRILSPTFFNTGACEGIIEIDVLLPVDDGASRFVTPANLSTGSIITRLSFDPGGTVSVLQPDPLNVGFFAFLPTTGTWTPNTVHTVRFAIVSPPYVAGAPKQTLGIVLDGKLIYMGEDINFISTLSPGFDVLLVENFGIPGMLGVGDPIIVDNLRVQSFVQVPPAGGGPGGGFDSGNGPGPAGPAGGGPGAGGGGGGGGGLLGVGPGGNGLILNNFESWQVAGSDFPKRQRIAESFDSNSDGETDGMVSLFYDPVTNTTTLDVEMQGGSILVDANSFPGEPSQVVAATLNTDGVTDFFVTTTGNTLFSFVSTVIDLATNHYGWTVTQIVNPDITNTAFENLYAYDLDSDGIDEACLSLQNLTTFKYEYDVIDPVTQLTRFNFVLPSDYLIGSARIGNVAGGPEADLVYGKLANTLLAVADLGTPQETTLSPWLSSRPINTISLGNADADARDEIGVSATTAFGFPLQTTNSHTVLDIAATGGGMPETITATDQNADSIRTQLQSTHALPISDTQAFETKEPGFRKSNATVAQSTVGINAMGAATMKRNGFIDQDIVALQDRSIRSWSVLFPMGNQVQILTHNLVSDTTFGHRTDTAYANPPTGPAGPSWFNTGAGGGLGINPAPGFVADTDGNGTPDLVGPNQFNNGIKIFRSESFNVVSSGPFGYLTNQDCIDQGLPGNCIIALPAPAGVTSNLSRLSWVEGLRVRAVGMPATIYALYEDGTLAAYVPDGSGGYLTPTTDNRTELLSVIKLEFGLINNDAIPDLVFVHSNNFSGNYGYLPGLLGGGFGPTVFITGSDISPGWDFSLGDFDHDLDTDIIVAFRDFGFAQLIIYQNDGTGAFPTPPILLEPPGARPGGIQSVLVEDIDLDGFTDIVLTQDDTLSINRGNGLVPIPASGWNSMQLTNGAFLKGVTNAGDLSGDGVNDLIVLAQDYAIPVLFTPYLGYPVLSRPLGLELYAAPAPMGMALADLNGDGANEFISFGGDDFSGTAPRTVIVEGIAPVLCFADFNNDDSVGGADLGVLLGGWAQPGASDLNGDGTTDGADLGLLLGAWGVCP